MKIMGWVTVLCAVVLLAGVVFIGVILPGKFSAIKSTVSEMEMQWDERWEARWNTLTEYEGRLHGELGVQAVETKKQHKDYDNRNDQLLNALRRLESRLLPPNERGFFE